MTYGRKSTTSFFVLLAAPLLLCSCERHVGNSTESTFAAALNVPPPGKDPDRPHIYNAPLRAEPGDVVSLQGDHLDSAAEVWLVGAPSRPAERLPLLNSADTEQIAVRIPPDWKGAMILWVANAHGNGNALRLNAAEPWNLDAMQLVGGGALKIVGLNLLMPGFVPRVTVDGRPASIDLSASTENMLVAIAPKGLPTTKHSSITVDNGNGTGPTSLDRPIEVVAGNGDPFSLGVGWGAAFTFHDRVVRAEARCDGSTDDSGAIQAAIDAAAAAGGVVKIPAGRCVLGKSVTLRSRVVMQGSGENDTILSYVANYPVYAADLDLVGLADLTIANSGGTEEGLLWKNNTRSFFLRIKVDSGVSRQLFLTGNRNFVVADCSFVQRGSIGGQNPYLFSESAGLVFRGNETRFTAGSPSFERVHDSLFWRNHFTRDATGQNDSPVIATHGFVMDFAYRISIIDNTFDVANGPITNPSRNDGQALITAGGAATRIETMGTVANADSLTLSDPAATFNREPFDRGTPENYGVAIINGRGAGQYRDVTAVESTSLKVDRPWDITPDTTSRYAASVWGLEKTLIKGNQLVGNPRGIWFYATAVRDVEIEGNRISEGGGIYLKAFQSAQERRFDTFYDVDIRNNEIKNSNGRWLSCVSVVFVNKDPAPLGTAATGVAIRGNVIVANAPNVVSTNEEYAGEEGLTVLMRSESGTARPDNGPALVGTILQANRCVGCDRAFVIGSGDYGTVLVDNEPNSHAAGSISDIGTLGPDAGTSKGTAIF
jgi:hypothetical protein